MSNQALLILADKNYIEHAKTVIGAIYSFGRWKDDIVVLTVGWNSEDCHEFNLRGIFTLPVMTQIPAGHFNWNKAAMFNPMLKHWEKVITLDCDTLVLDDINPIIDMVERKDTLYACRSHVPKRFEFDLRKLRRTPCHELQCLLDELDDNKVLNSGVMAYNTDVIGKKVSERKIVELAHRFRNYYKCRDEAVLNLIFPDFVELPQEYNVQTAKMINKIYEGKILHFLSKGWKPWQSWETHEREGLELSEELKENRKRIASKWKWCRKQFDYIFLHEEFKDCGFI